MDKEKRFDIFWDNHIGLGIRWATGWTHAFNLSIALVFFTVTIAFGKQFEGR